MKNIYKRSLSQNHCELMADKSMITTAVDDLIHLVKESGKISLMEAAKQLDVPQKTVETWVDFLVEEERLSIEYKFTTPYIFLNKDFVDEEEELSISKEDFESEIKREEIAVDEGEGKFHEYVTKIINQFKNIQLLITQKKLDQAYEQYNLLSVDINELPKSELANIFNRNLIKLNYGLLMLYKEFTVSSKELATKMETLAQTGSAFLEKEEVEQAKKTYVDMKQLYDSIPLMMTVEREGLYDAMYFFFKKIIKVERAMIERTRKESESKIKHIQSEINRFLHENKVREAEKHLVSLKEIYYSLPAELVSYKLLIYNEILRMYEEVSIAGRFEVLKSELDQLGSDIKLPPLSDLIHSPLASAIEAPHNEHFNVSAKAGNVAPISSTSSKDQIKSTAKEEDALSELPKVETVSSSTKPKETPVKKIPTTETSAEESPVGKSVANETLAKETQRMPLENNSIVEPKKESNPFETSSPESFTTTSFSKDNPIMNKALEAYNEKNYAKAKELFQLVIHTEPDNSKAKQMLSIIDGMLSPNTEQNTTEQRNISAH